MGLITLSFRSLLVASFYHAPGPVGKTVLIPDLKSGIPVEVEIPAPVKTMKCLDY